MTRSQKTPAIAYSRGFTLLEAIVAIVIIGACLIPLLGFISQATLQLQRAGDANARSIAQESILNFLETLNPMAQPTGRIILGGLTVDWTSEVIVPANTSVRIGAGLPQFSVGFYRVNVVAARGNGPGWFTFSARKVGYQRLNSTDMLGAQPLDAQPFGAQQ